MKFPYRMKLFASHATVVVVAMSLAVALLDRFLVLDLERQIDDRLERHALGAAAWIGEAEPARTDQLAYRIASIVGADVSIFDREGTLLAESRDRRRDRVVRVEPEIVAARRSGIGRGSRRSEGGGQFRFLAVATDQGYILRLAVPLADVQATVVGMRGRLLGGASLGIAIAAALAVFASRLAARPLAAMTRLASQIANGNYSVDIAERSPDEFGRLADALDRMAQQLRQRTMMRRDYLANISHELRTPVTAIQGYAETLLDQSLGVERARHFVEIIHRQAIRIGGLVEELMVLADLEVRPADTAKLERVEVDAIASLVIDTLEASIAAAGAHVEIDPTARIAVLAEADALERILQNLVENALRYGRPKGTIRISARPGGTSVTVEIADDGPGIAAEHLPRIFERFYRVDPARSREKGGAGLGLAIVKHCAELMGGHVRVRSELGRGTCFGVELRAAPKVLS